MTHKTPGAHDQLSGYVTTLESIAGKSAGELEQSLGFGAGALGSGFLVFALTDPIEIQDFEWKDRTTYSAGWHYDRTIGEYVQRQDELRAHLGKRNSYNETATDAKILQLMQVQVQRLNVRTGPGRIVKVVPKTNISLYPDAAHRNVPQWKLRVRKAFTCLADIPAGGSYS